MRQTLTRFFRHETGGAMVEFAFVLPIIVLVLGLVFDLILAFWQWNSAVKALERGARIAAVSGPVATNLATLNNVGCATCKGGESYLSTPSYAPNFTITCSGSSQTCTSPATGYDATTMQWIVYGRGNTACANVTSAYSIGMCHLVPMLTPPLAPANIRVIYKTSDLGYAMRPAGPVVTISVQFDPTNPPRFTFFFLGWLFNPLLMRFANAETITSEDLCSQNTC